MHAGVADQSFYNKHTWTVQDRTLNGMRVQLIRQNMVTETVGKVVRGNVRRQNVKFIKGLWHFQCTTPCAQEQSETLCHLVMERPSLY